MGRGSIPKGWNDYVRTGKRINKTRFIAFKVPLREGPNQNRNIKEEDKWHPKLVVTTIPDIGIVIDITNTSKYYHPQDFLELGVDHKKIFIEGHHIPPTGKCRRFHRVVREFLENNRDNDKLIGVHCTHGLNRTGFLVCRYMIEEMNMSADEAISLFQDARGHKIRRGNYINKLKNLASPLPESGSNFGQLPYALPPSRTLRTDGHYDNWRDSRPSSGSSASLATADVSVASAKNLLESSLKSTRSGSTAELITSPALIKSESNMPQQSTHSDSTKRDSFHSSGKITPDSYRGPVHSAFCMPAGEKPIDKVIEEAEHKNPSVLWKSQIGIIRSMIENLLTYRNVSYFILLATAIWWRNRR